MLVTIEITDEKIRELVAQSFQDWDVQKKLKDAIRARVLAIDLATAVASEVSKCVNGIVEKTVREELEIATKKQLKLALKLAGASGE